MFIIYYYYAFGVLMYYEFLLRVRELGLDKPKPMSEAKLKLNFPGKKSKQINKTLFKLFF